MTFRPCLIKEANLIPAGAIQRYRYAFPALLTDWSIELFFVQVPSGLNFSVQCQYEMRIMSLIDEAAVIERILRHLGLWEAGVWVDDARAPPEPFESVIEPWLDDPFPDYDYEPVFAGN